MFSIYLYLDEKEKITNYLKIIKNYSPLGLIEIKKKVLNGEPIYQVNAVKIDEVIKLKELADEIIKNNGSIKLVEGSFYNDKNVERTREITMENINNKILSSKQTAEELERLDDLMYGDDE